MWVCKRYSCSILLTANNSSVPLLNDKNLKNIYFHALMHSAPVTVLDFILYRVSLGGYYTPVYSTLLKLMGSRRLASVLFRDFF